jgi:tetratricopeptide (TPR) repeat protein
MSPGGQYVATGGGTDPVRVWDPRGPWPDGDGAAADRTARARAAWHERLADESEKSGDWFATAFHLGRLILTRPDDPTLRARRSVACGQLGRWEVVVEDCTRLVKGGAADGPVLTRRGRALTNLGRWQEAAADLTRAFEEFDQAWAGAELARLRLRDGDRAGHRQVCARLLERFGGTEEPAVADGLAWVCVLAPDAVPDPARLVALAERALAREKKWAYLETVGAALYRAGRFREAVERLDEAVRGHGKGGSAATQVFLAMAHHRLGHRDEAGQWLARAVKQVGGEKDLSWQDRVAWESLRREAEGLLR